MKRLGQRQRYRQPQIKRRNRNTHCTFDLSHSFSNNAICKCYLPPAFPLCCNFLVFILSFPLKTYSLSNSSSFAYNFPFFFGNLCLV